LKESFGAAQLVAKHLFRDKRGHLGFVIKSKLLKITEFSLRWIRMKGLKAASSCVVADKSFW